MGGNPGGPKKTMNRKSNQRSRRRQEETDGATEPTTRSSGSTATGEDQPDQAPDIQYFPA